MLTPLELLVRVTAYLGSLGPSHGGPGGHERDDRGDVPGWVLVTVMTAGLVAALWAVAGPQLQAMLREALNSVG